MRSADLRPTPLTLVRAVMSLLSKTAVIHRGLACRIGKGDSRPTPCTPSNKSKQAQFTGVVKAEQEGGRLRTINRAKTVTVLPSRGRPGGALGNPQQIPNASDHQT